MFLKRKSSTWQKSPQHLLWAVKADIIAFAICKKDNGFENAKKTLDSIHYYFQ